MMTWLAIPEFALGGSALLVLVLDAMLPNRRRLAGWVAASSLFIVLYLLLSARELALPSIFSGDFTYSNMSWIFKLVVTSAGLGAILLASDYFRDDANTIGTVTSLLLFSILGMFVLISSSNLLILFLGLEMMTFPVYLAVSLGRGKRDEASLEAAVKYFVLGSVSSAIFLFGLSLIYAAGGSLSLNELPALLHIADSRLLTIIKKRQALSHIPQP